MNSEQKLRKLVEHRMPGLTVILSIFALVEFGILMVCIAYSANQDKIRIYNPKNKLIYEDIYHSDQVSEFRKMSGIDNFKNQGFTVTRVTVENKFPTRAWIALSICIPIFLILFVAFIVNVFTDVFQTRPPDAMAKEKTKKEVEFEETRFEKFFSTLGRLNIYALGGAAIGFAFFYWMIPDMLLFIGKLGYQTLFDFKWVLLGVSIFAGAYLILKMILSYKTRNIIIKQQADIQKNRDRLMIEAKLDKAQKLLEDSSEE